MFLKMFFSVIIFIVSPFSLAETQSLHPLVKIPNQDSYLMFFRTKLNDFGDVLKVMMVNPEKNTITYDNHYSIDGNEKIISIFFRKKKSLSNVYVLIKSPMDETIGLKGFSYSTFIYELWGEDKIKASQIPMLALEDCMDGIDLESGKKYTCKYKDERSVLHYLKYGD